MDLIIPFPKITKQNLNAKEGLHINKKKKKPKLFY